MTGPIRVVVVEDHQLVLEGLVAALDSTEDFTVVASARSLGELRELSPIAADVIVSDLDLPDGTGTETATDEGPPVLLITGQGDAAGVRAALSAGCAGFVSKGSPLRELRRAIRVVASGGSFFAVDVVQAAMHQDRRAAAARLTERERAVLQQLAEGSNAQTIATELHLSLHTVRNHIRAVREKLGATSQLEAVVIAVRDGIITFPGAG